MYIYLITKSIRKWFLLTYKVKISCLINSRVTAISAL